MLIPESFHLEKQIRTGRKISHDLLGSLGENPGENLNPRELEMKVDENNIITNNAILSKRIAFALIMSHLFTY